MTEKRFLIKCCNICKHYCFQPIHLMEGKTERVKHILMCEIYGNVNPNKLCCTTDFELRKQVEKELIEYNAKLLTIDEIGDF